MLHGNDVGSNHLLWMTGKHSDLLLLETLVMPDTLFLSHIWSNLVITEGSGIAFKAINWPGRLFPVSFGFFPIYLDYDILRGLVLWHQCSASRLRIGKSHQVLIVWYWYSTLVSFRNHARRLSWDFSPLSSIFFSFLLDYVNELFTESGLILAYSCKFEGSFREEQVSNAVEAAEMFEVFDTVSNLLHIERVDRVVLWEYRPL